METQGISYQAMPLMGAGYGGDGFGGSGLGGLLIGALLGRGFGFGNDGRFGRRDDCGDCVTPAQFISGLNNVVDTIGTTAILGKLGSIEGAIPLASAQTENVILQQTNALNGGLASLALGTQQAFANTKDTVQNGTLANAVGFCNNLSAIKDAQFALATAVKADGDQTRALIVAQNEANLNRQLTVAENALIEERGFRRSRESEINITNSNTNTNFQAQAQVQAQSQAQLLAALVAEVRNLSNDVQVVRQTQSNINFGVQAGVGQGQQATNNRVS